jgi:hypothetical protein
MKMSLRLIPYVLVQLMILLLVGMGDLFEAGWDPTRLASADFWFSYATITLATLLSFFSWANVKIDAYLETPYHVGMENNPNTNLNDVGVVAAIKKNLLSNLVLRYKTSDLPEFLDEHINLVEKTEVYVERKTNQLIKYREGWRSTCVLTRKGAARKVKIIKEQLSDEYIKNNIKNIKVKYVPVTEAYVINGTTIRAGKVHRHRQIGRARAMLKDNIHKWVLSLSYLLLLTSLSIEFGETMSWAVAYSMAIKIINCVFQSLMGINYAKDYMTNKVIAELDDRTAIMEMYVEKKKKGVA